MAENYGRSPASGVGPAPQGAEPAAQSQAEPLVPNADEADMLGGILAEMDCHLMTDTQRAVALVSAWEAIKAYPAVPFTGDEE